MSDRKNMKLFALNSNQEIAQKIAQAVGVPLGKLSSRQFSDGEIQVNIEESVRGYDVYIIQSTSFPVNNHLMELLIMVDACVRASAHSINVVLPYFGYARQDRIASPREPLTAKLVANMLVKAGVDRVLTLDLKRVEIPQNFRAYGDDIFSDKKKIYKEDYPDVYITRRNDVKQPYIMIRKKADGYNVPIGLSVPVEVSGNAVLLPNYISYSYDQRFRDYDVDYELVIPETMEIKDLSDGKVDIHGDEHGFYREEREYQKHHNDNDDDKTPNTTPADDALEEPR